MESEYDTNCWDCFVKENEFGFWLPWHHRYCFPCNHFLLFYHLLGHNKGFVINILIDKEYEPPKLDEAYWRKIYPGPGSKNKTRTSRGGIMNCRYCLRSHNPCSHHS